MAEAMAQADGEYVVFTSTALPAASEPRFPEAKSKMVGVEHRPGHRPFESYSLPRWVKHPDAPPRNTTYLQPEDYLGSRKVHNHNGWNVAHVGAQCAEFEAQGFKMLQKATKREINVQDLTEGWTPLHWAVLSDNPKAVVWLLKNGADPDIRDFRGRLAADFIEDHWGELNKRSWEYITKGDSQEKQHQLTPEAMTKARKTQMKEAFKLNVVDNDWDAVGYKQIQV